MFEIGNLEMEKTPSSMFVPNFCATDLHYLQSHLSLGGKNS